MNPNDDLNKQVVFTLTEDTLQKPVISSANVSNHQMKEATEAWEKKLERLRQDKHASPVTGNVPADYGFPQSNRKKTTDIGSISERLSVLDVHRDATDKHQDKSIGSKHDDDILDPVKRERAYQTYLQEWRRRTNLEQKQQTALNDEMVLLQEDWLAAQSCLKKASDDEPTACTVRLHKNKPAEIIAEDQILQHTQQDEVSSSADALDNTSSVVDVHLHVIEPQGAQSGAVTCLSEHELLQQLMEKLRLHLADAMAGLLRVAVQKETVQLVKKIQQQLLNEIPDTVDEVLQHNFDRVMKQIKKEQRQKQSKK